MTTTGGSNNNNNTSSTESNTNPILMDNNNTSISSINMLAKPLQPAGYQPLFKKHRAPAPPPPQAGVAAATVSIIRQSSFLYGPAGLTSQQQLQ